MTTAREMIAVILEPARLNLRAPRSRDFTAEFCDSILRRVAGGKPVSEKQVALLVRLYSEATAPAEAAPAPAATLAGNGIDSLRALFEHAKASGLKRPSIKVTCQGVNMQLSRAPDSGTNPGAIYVRAEGEYAGKVLASGGFMAVRTCPANVAPALEAFGADPAGMAGASGRATGECSFCSRALTDVRSLQVGYGPICAGKYGLPWGEPAEMAKAA